MRRHQGGYSDFLNLIPIIEKEDPYGELKLEMTASVMKALAGEIAKADWIHHDVPPDGKVTRTFVAIEGYTAADKEPVALAVLQWGKGAATPVHGHDMGLLYESLILGSLVTDRFRCVGPGMARPLQSGIQRGRGHLAASFSSNSEIAYSHGVHRVEAITPSVSLHFLPAPPKEGVANKIAVEEFHPHGAIPRQHTQDLLHRPTQWKE